MIPKEQIDSVRVLECESRILKDQIRAIEAANEIPHMRARAAELKAEADQIRDGWHRTYAQVHELAVQGICPLPELPKGVHMIRRTVLSVTDQDALPREALEPKQSLLKADMPGVTASTVFGSSVTKGA